MITYHVLVEYITWIINQPGFKHSETSSLSGLLRFSQAFYTADIYPYPWALPYWNGDKISLWVRPLSFSRTVVFVFIRVTCVACLRQHKYNGPVNCKLCYNHVLFISDYDLCRNHFCMLSTSLLLSYLSIKNLASTLRFRNAQPDMLYSDQMPILCAYKIT